MPACPHVAHPPVATACLQHKAEVAQLIGELSTAGAAALGVTLDAGVEERLCAYARSGALRCAVRLWLWLWLLPTPPPPP